MNYKKNLKKKYKKDNVLHGNTGLFNTINAFFKKNEKIFLGFSLFFTIFFSLLLFDIKISVGGDDSAYIQRAYKFIHEGIFPTYQGPLYPLFLSIFIAIASINIPLLKLCSLFFILIHNFFFYKSLKNFTPPLLLHLVLLLISINAPILYFASQTYSEAMFMSIYIIFVFYFLKYFNNEKQENLTLKNYYGKYLLIGFLILLLGLTRHIGYASLFAIIVFLFLKKEFKHIFYIFLSFLLMFLSFNGLKKIFWGSAEIQFQQQLKQLMYKDPYDKSKGVEDFIGYIQRLFNNADLYISKRFFDVLGIRPDATTTNTFLTSIILTIFIFGIFILFKRNKGLLFTFLLSGIMLFVTFVILQTRWDQTRLIIPYFPFFLLGLLSTLYYLIEQKREVLQLPFVFLIIILLFPNFSRSFSKARKNLPVLRKNLKGNIYYGYTPDWINYLKMVEWAAKNVPQNKIIACRKPSMAFIYSKGRKFYGIYRVNSENPDSLLNNLKKHKVEYVIMANLRRDPKRKTQYTINTVRRYLGYIQKKYPYAIRQVHKIGISEEAYLFYIDYPKN